MSVSRRQMLAATALTGAAVSAPVLAQTIGNPDEPPQGLINTRGDPRSVANPGPQSPAIADQFPDVYNPQPTDIGDLPLFWARSTTRPAAPKTAAGPAR